MKLSEILLILALSATLTCCTYTISMVHTEGQASDVIDETNANTPNISPTITATAIPGV